MLSGCGRRKVGKGIVIAEPSSAIVCASTNSPRFSQTVSHAVDTTTFEEKAGITKVTLTVLYESKDARDTASRSGMERGMAAGYDRLEPILAEIAKVSTS